MEFRKLGWYIVHYYLFHARYTSACLIIHLQVRLCGNYNSRIDGWYGKIQWKMRKHINFNEHQTILKTTLYQKQYELLDAWASLFWGRAFVVQLWTFAFSVKHQSIMHVKKTQFHYLLLKFYVSKMEVWCSTHTRTRTHTHIPTHVYTE
jgi:hypothetical protein